MNCNEIIRKDLTTMATLVSVENNSTKNSITEKGKKKELKHIS